MKILVTGANGMLAHHLIPMLLEEGKFHVYGMGRCPCRVHTTPGDNFEYIEADLSRFQQLETSVKKLKPHIIIHGGAVTQPDNCAAHPDVCWKTNVGGTRALLRAAKACRAFFIYISTDFVFDGKKGPYKETDEPHPVNLYGYTKWLGEQMVRTADVPWCIVRTISVYGPSYEGGRSNFVTRVRDALQAGRLFKAVNDQWRTPVYVGDVARAILLVILKGAQGIYHIGGKEMLTPYQLALKVAELLALDKNLIVGVTTASISEPALRPPKTGFILTMAYKELGFEPLPLLTGLRKTFDVR